MKKLKLKSFYLFLISFMLVLSGCGMNTGKKITENSVEMEQMDFSNETEHVIYLACGCFWGIEHLFASIPGGIDAKSGYANGTSE